MDDLITYTLNTYDISKILGGVIVTVATVTIIFIVSRAFFCGSPRTMTQNDLEEMNRQLGFDPISKFDVDNINHNDD